MKQLNFAFILWLSISVSLGQVISGTTNEMHLNLQEGVLPNSNQLPAIKWVSPRLEYTSSPESKVDIDVEIKSRLNLKELKVSLGGRTDGVVYASKMFNIKNVEGVYHLHQTISLDKGSNFVEVTASNIEGATVSSHRDILVGSGFASETALIDRKDHALMFVTDKYDNWDDLVNPVEDGKAIAKVLQEKYGFEVEIVENATTERVWEKLRAYNDKKFKPQDQLLVFFAGHGQFDETFGEGYVVTKNSLRKDPSRNSYISHNRLRGVINNIPIEHIFLMMDVCYGGTLDPVISRTRGSEDTDRASNSEFIARKLSLRTRKFLTSGGKEYVSDGVPGKHSPFAARFLESLASYGGDDGILTTFELITHLEKLTISPRFGSFAPEPSGSDFIFIAKQQQ
ncbi:MAG TPA: caspase family protein [Cyclobacteriaceae bacterium]|nr:caspase family protein [Cyclobacteriaceae bacterium]